MQDACGLHELGVSALHRFQTTRALDDLSEALSLIRQAVDEAANDCLDLPMYLGDLAKALTCRYELSGDVNDVSQAISLGRRAIDLAPNDHPSLPDFLTNVGISLMHQFKDTENLADILDAISLQQKAINLTPDENKDKAIYQTNLGVFFTRRFEYTKQLNDISDAVNAHQEASRLGGLYGHPDLLQFQSNLWQALELCFEHSQELALIQKATTSFRRFSTSQLGSPSKELRLNARKWAEYAKKVDSLEILQAWSNVLQLSAQVVGLEHTIQQRYTFLLDISELSVSAAAAAFDQGRPYLALEWLEEGRCLVWGQLNRFRSPLDALRIRNPALAEEFMKVSKALESAGSRPEPDALSKEVKKIHDTSLEDEADVRNNLAKEWDKLLERIRNIPGFGNFFRPATYPTLMKDLPPSAIVIVVNVHQDRSDALILISGLKAPLHLPLPDLPYDKVDNYRRALQSFIRHIGLRARGSELERRERGMRLETHIKTGSITKEVLGHLWNALVRPILNKLGLMKEPPSQKVRIWWCSTGPLAFLPVHAAGLYKEDGSSVTISDYAVLSYIPSVSALIERAKRPLDIDTSSGLIMISQPDTPGQSPLPGATREIQRIGQVLEASNVRYSTLDRSVATVEEGIKQMNTYSCIHFACHARQDTAEPLKSAFNLYDGPLELGTIMQQNLAQADLAFLAACQTSTVFRINLVVMLVGVAFHFGTRCVGQLLRAK